MRVYFLEEPLAPEDLAFVAESFGLGLLPEQVRIPYVLPMLASEGDFVTMVKRHEELLRSHLRRAGIGRDRGSQVAFVAPRDMHWNQVIAFAIRAETGYFPYVVQTEAQREAMGNRGSLRILDTEGLCGFKK
jgi:hypothetical protein